MKVIVVTYCKDEFFWFPDTEAGQKDMQKKIRAMLRSANEIMFIGITVVGLTVPDEVNHSNEGITDWIYSNTNQFRILPEQSEFSLNNMNWSST